MKFKLVKTNWFIKKIFSNYCWDLPNSEGKIYLTFDDGPTPEVTDWVLNQLKKHKAKATFFCIGENIQKHPSLFQKLISEGHTIGNHTYNHLNGWKNTDNDYLENVLFCKKKLEDENLKFDETFSIQNPNLKSQNLFRPPYGKIKPSQSSKIRRLGYKIIMWDIISYDFDNTISQEQCLKNVLKNIKPGSIIVFHDSEKAFKNLKYTLPKVLEYCTKKKIVCEALV